MKRFLEVASFAAASCRTYLKSKLKSEHTITNKRGDVDIVTDADKEVQVQIVKILSDSFPEHNILTEEKGGDFSGSKSDYTWVIDPIDGTSAFSAGFPTFSVSIALLKNNTPVIGVIYTALTDEAVCAIKGKGVFIGGKKQSVSTKKKLEKSTVGFDPSYFNREEFMKLYASPLAAKVRILPLIYSQATSLCLVAKGIFDGYLQCGKPSIWDVAAGMLLVEESGGVVTDTSGKNADLFLLRSYIAGNEFIHGKLLKFYKTRSK